MSELLPQNNQQLRWIRLADKLLDDKKTYSAEELAEIFGVCRKTIERDLKDIEFQRVLDYQIRRRLKTDVLAAALRNIFEEILHGKHKSKLSTSKWLLEKLEYLIPKKELQEDDTQDIIEGEFIELSNSANGESPELSDLINEMRRRLNDAD